MKVYGFPGQGSQFRGMGADLFVAFPEYAARADAVLSYPIRTLCLENPENRLRLTQFTQPALYVVEVLAYLQRCREDPEPPAYLVGHSLGEYVALFAAGVFDFETGLRLVQRRGELMNRVEGGMAAVVGCDLATVEAVLADTGLTALDVANCNAPDQTVLAGPTEEIERAQPIFAAKGARFVVLNVSAPFHSRYMQAAGHELRSLLDETEIRPLHVPVIANLDGRPYEVDRLKETLALQVSRPVLWVDTIHYLMRKGDFTFHELGPGQALTKLVKKIREASSSIQAPEPFPVVVAPEAEEPPSMPQPTSASLHGALGPDDLGAATFRERYGLRYAYVVGSMYGGISAGDMIIRLARSGILGFFGTGGLRLATIEDGLRAILAEFGPAAPFGANLLHQYAHPEHEKALVNLLLRLGVRTVEASGFLQITPALVKYRLKGGRILAKVSRADVAEAFLRPAPEHLVRRLLEQGEVTAEEARQEGGRPMADDLCVEADAGWHSTGAGLATLLPTILRRRDLLSGSGPRVHVGAAGGIGTPEAAAAAFVLGADFIVTGSINQCTVEAATSAEVKDMLQQLGVDDTDFAPWSEMFELGERARVVKRGVFSPARATRLYELWRQYDLFEAIDSATRRQIEENYLGRPLNDVYQDAKARLLRIVPEAASRAHESPKQKLALAFQFYLDRGFELALAGDPSRRVDYLVYCGPAMGAFNQWVRGTELEPWRARHVDAVAHYLMEETARVLQDRCTLLVSPGTRQGLRSAERS